jgi:DNA-directed RNA polymerase specialized sigma24 family protein
MLDQVRQWWAHWMATPRAERQLASWVADHPALEGWPLQQLETPRSSPRTDTMQAALVQLAQGGDQTAVLVLLTQLRPGLLCISRADRRRSEMRDCATEGGDVVAFACETILRHPLDRRPSSIAANLLLDTRQRLHRARGANPVDRGVPIAGHRQADLATVDESEACIDGLDLVDRLASAIERSTTDRRSRQLSAEVAFRAWFLDEPAPTIAAAVGLRPDAVRARLSRLRAAVRATGPA